MPRRRAKTTGNILLDGILDNLPQDSFLHPGDFEDRRTLQRDIVDKLRFGSCGGLPGRQGLDFVDGAEGLGSNTEFIARCRLSSFEMIGPYQQRHTIRAYQETRNPAVARRSDLRGISSIPRGLLLIAIPSCARRMAGK
jgi:hypothetical protein